jgi:pentatricopeptide repeat protein
LKDIAPDVFTYTSAIDTLAKAESVRWSESAEKLLLEMLDEYRQTLREDLKPNVRTFTSVINSFGRSKERPERCFSILEVMRELDIEPDAICYNAVINAFGWAHDVPNREIIVYDLLQEMLQSSSAAAKPDIITANSILNACAYATASSSASMTAVAVASSAVQIAIDTFEFFQQNAPTYGWPDHVTYGNLLLVVAQQMSPSSPRAIQMVETIFAQACQKGHVSPLVLQRLHRILPNDRLIALLGSKAIIELTSSSFVFDMAQLPSQWTQFAPRYGQRRNSRPSRKEKKQRK